MAIKFNDDHKVEKGGNYFDEGVHLVKITDVKADKNANGKDFFEFAVSDGTREAKVKLWFSSDAAINFSFNTIRAIFVHNSPTDQKDKMRATIDGIEDSDKLLEACKKLKGKECWLEVVQDGEYTDEQTGEVKKSYNRNIRGYEPTPKAVTTDNAPTKASEPADSGDSDQVMADF